MNNFKWITNSPQRERKGTGNAGETEEAEEGQLGLRVGLKSVALPGFQSLLTQKVMILMD